MANFAHAFWCESRWKGSCTCNAEYPAAKAREHTLGGFTRGSETSAPKPPAKSPFPCTCTSCGLPFYRDSTEEEIRTAMTREVAFFCQACLAMYNAIEYNEYFKGLQRQYQHELATMGKKPIWSI